MHTVINSTKYGDFNMTTIDYKPEHKILYN